MPFDYRDFEDRPVRTTFLGMTLGWALASIGTLLVIATVAIVWSLGVFSSGAYGHGEQVKQVNSGQNRIASYNHFFDLKASYESQLKTVRIAKQTLNDFTKANPPDVRAADPTGNLESAYTQDLTNPPPANCELSTSDCTDLLLVWPSGQPSAEGPRPKPTRSLTGAKPNLAAVTAVSHNTRSRHRVLNH